MKKLSALLAALVVLSLPVSAQTKHPVLAVAFVQAQSGPTATVSWAASVTPGGTVTVYRCVGTPCTALSSFTQLAAGVTPAGPYVDSTVTAGSYSYYLTLTVNGATSVASNIATGSLSPQPPTNVTVTP